MFGELLLKMDVKYLGIIFVAVLLSRTEAELPDYVHKCRRDDPQLSKCALESAQKALPFLVKGDSKYGLPSLNPIQVERIQHEQADLSLNLTDVKFYGMDTVAFKDMTFDLQNMKFAFTLYFRVITVLANYSVHGTILHSSICGKGKSNVTLTELETTFNCDIQYVEKEDKRHYLQPSNMKYLHQDDKLTRTFYDFTNVLDGDTAKAEATLQKMNQNWKKTYDILGPVFLTPLEEATKGFLLNIGTNIPIEQLFL